MEDDEDDDLYDMALGEKYAPQSFSESSSMKNEYEEPTISCSPQKSGPPVEYKALFHKLLTGSRTQIEQLKKENSQLKTNLENAISSGGVVTCPNCTHHFKDRHCQMRPRAMKKMRARNCVELEFNSLDDLETWLYLNQLETNNDGMPTVMNVKKGTEKSGSSLKQAGSLIPELMEKKKEEKGSNERSKKNSRVSKSPTRSKDRTSSGQPEKYEVRTSRTRKDVSPCRSRERRDSHNRKSTPRPAEKRSEKRSETRDSSHKPTVQEGRKRKNEKPTENELEPKTSRKTLADRIRFPGSEKPDNSKLEKNPTTSASIPKLMDKEVEPPKRTRDPIVWDDHKPIDKKTLTEKPVRNSIEFKIPEKKKQKAAAAKVVSAPASTTEEKPKFKFVPTAKKNSAILESVPAKEKEWNVLPVKKSSHVLDHIYKRSIERHKHKWAWPSKTIVVFENRENTEKAENVENRSISAVLKQIGVSAEGIATLRKQLKPVNEYAENTVLEVDDSRARKDVTNSEKPEVSHPVEHQENPSTTASQDQKFLSPPKSSDSNPPEEAHASGVANDISLEDDVFHEFFPDLAVSRPKPERQLSMETIGCVTDQEEDELLDLIREDSAAPPNGDYMEEMEEEEEEQVTIVEKNQDWREFCLEDVDDEVDEVDEEVEETDAGVEESGEEEERESVTTFQDEEEHMEWLENVEEGRQSEPLDMESDFRLSDEEDLVSPMTSTPKHCNDYEEDEMEKVAPNDHKNDSFIEELDWNYGSEGEEGVGEDDTEEKDESTPVNTNGLEDGEISEDEEEQDDVKDSSHRTKSSPKKRDRIRYDDRNDKQSTHNHSRERHEHSERKCSRLTKNRRRSSEENQRFTSYKKDKRPATYLPQDTCLKRRN